MKKTIFQKAASVFFLLILPLSFPYEKEMAEASEPRPNILFIITDDQERREFNFLEEGRTESKPSRAKRYS